MPNIPSLVNFLHSGAGGQRLFPGLQAPISVSGQGGGMAQARPGQPRQVDVLRAFLQAGSNPMRLTGSGGFLSQTDPMAAIPGLNMLARMNPNRFQGGGDGGGR